MDNSKGLSFFVRKNVNYARSNEEKKKYAQQLIDYPFDTVWNFQRVVNGANKETGWKKVK